MIRRACLVGLALLCADPVPARKRGGVLERASAAGLPGPGAEDGVDLGGVLRRIGGEGRADAARSGRAWVTRAEWRGLLDRARRPAGARDPESDARTLALLHRAYARRAGLDETRVTEVRALVLVRLRGEATEPELGEGARAWLEQGRSRPLAGVAPEILARVNAEILASYESATRPDPRLRDRLRLIEIWLGADPRAAAADLPGLAVELALADPALRELLEAAVWTTGASAR